MGYLKEKYPIVADSHFVRFLENGMAQIAEDILYDIIVFDKIKKEPWRRGVYEAYFRAYEDFTKENPILIIPKLKGEFVHTDIKTLQRYERHYLGNSVDVLAWEFYEIKPLVAEECTLPHLDSLLNAKEEDMQREYARRVIRRVPVADRVIEDIDWASDIEKSKRRYEEYTSVFTLPPLKELVGKSVREDIDYHKRQIKLLADEIKEHKESIEKAIAKLNSV